MKRMCKPAGAGLLLALLMLLVSDVVPAQTTVVPAQTTDGFTLPKLKPVSPTLPFELPQQLYQGSRLRFPAAREVHSFDYSGEGQIKVYLYDTRFQAENDIALGTAAAESISAEESPLLHRYRSGMAREGRWLRQWFLTGTRITAISVPADAVSRADLLKTGEEIIARNLARLQLLFATPEMCLATYLRAIEEQNVELIVECFHQDNTPGVTGSIRKLRTVMPLTGLVRILDGDYIPERSQVSGRLPEGAELISDQEARLKVVRGDESDMTSGTMAVELLYLAVGLNDNYRDECWIPLRRSDGIWGIDLAALKETSFARSRQEAVRDSCQNNLKQIGMAVLMYTQDHEGGSAPDLKSLLDYCLHDDSCFCPAAGDGHAGSEPRVAYTYIRPPGVKTTDASRLIVAHDAAPDFHDNGRNVLFLDARVKWYPEAEFQELLKQQAALRKAPAPAVKKSAPAAVKKPAAKPGPKKGK